jgi:hypothetical protein
MYSHWLGTTDYLIYLICDYYLKRGMGLLLEVEQQIT